MLKHVVMWKFEGSEEERVARAQALGEALENLVGNVPSLLGAIARSANPELENSYDLILIADFADVDGLNAYQKHPDHIEVAKRIKELSVERAAIDFMI